MISELEYVMTSLKRKCCCMDGANTTTKEMARNLTRAAPACMFSHRRTILPWTRSLGRRAFRIIRQGTQGQQRL